MVPTVQCVRIPGTPFSLTPTTTPAYRMTAADEGNSDDDTRCPVSTIFKGEVPCCGEARQEEAGVSGEEDSHCGGGCCAGDEADRESSVDNCEDSCCGHQEDHSVAGEPTREDQEDGISGVAESHCAGACCGDDEGDCESVVDNCEDSCCGREEDHGVVEESKCKDDQGTNRIDSCVQGSSLIDTSLRRTR